MDRRSFVLAAAAASLTRCASSDSTVSAQTWAPYDGSTIIDALGFIGSRGDRGVPLPDDVLAQIAASGVTTINTTVGLVGDRPNPFDITMADLDRWDQRFETYANQLLKVTDASHIDTAKATSRMGVIMGFQDAVMLEGDVNNVSTFYERGVRVIQLTYNRRNALGDGSLEADNRGLTDFGRAVVDAMEAHGILVDLSHCGQQTTADGVAHARGPVSITHSGCLALSNLPRNKPDDVMRALADKGGVFGVYLMPFLREEGQPNADDVVRHIEHAIDVCGEDHVGIGTDGTVSPQPLTEEYRAAIRAEVQARQAAGISAPGEAGDVVPLIPDLNDARRLEHLAFRLAQRGHGDAQIEKILGSNFKRLFAEVWSP